MKKHITSQNGPQNHGYGRSVAELLAALGSSHYHQLTSFARWRLRTVMRSRHAQQWLAIVDPEDLVDEALLKLLLGDDNPGFGRRLKPVHRASIETFLIAVKGVINSDLAHLIRAAHDRGEHLPLGNPETELGAVEPAAPENFYGLLLRSDLRRVLFALFYERIRRQPALLRAVQDWDQRFLEDERIGADGEDPNVTHRVRRLAREILADLAAELSSNPGDGKEMLL